MKIYFIDLSKPEKFEEDFNQLFFRNESAEEAQALFTALSYDPNFRLQMQPPFYVLPPATPVSIDSNWYETQTDIALTPYQWEYRKGYALLPNGLKLIFPINILQSPKSAATLDDLRIS